MALLQYGNKNVDDRFSPLVEPNLFDNAVFQPGLTFTDKYQVGPAGQILVHKLGKVTVSASTPGSDFSNTDTADTVITISLDKAFQRSEKIYNAVSSTVAYAAAATQMEQALNDIREGWQAVAATELETTTTVSAAGTTALSATNVYDTIVDDRKVLVDNGAKPDTIIVSPATFAVLLKSDEFQRTGTIGDQVVANGNVGRIAGMNVLEYQGLGATTDYLMYDKDALSIVTAVNMMRLKDSEVFNGVLAQAEIVSGFKVTNVERVLKKLNA